MIGLRGLDLRLGAGGLAADIGIIQLQQQLAFAHVIAFLYQKTFYRSCNRRVRFEVLDGLNLAVGGDQAADRSALHRDRVYLQRSLVQIGIEYGEKQNECGGDPYPPPSGRCVRIVQSTPTCCLSECGRNFCKE